MVLKLIETMRVFSYYHKSRFLTIIITRPPACTQQAHPSYTYVVSCAVRYTYQAHHRPRGLLHHRPPNCKLSLYCKRVCNYAASHTTEAVDLFHSFIRVGFGFQILYLQNRPCCLTAFAKASAVDGKSGSLPLEHWRLPSWLKLEM